MMATLELDHLFGGRRVPAWLLELEADPDTALRDLLVGRASLGHLNAEDPSEVLLDWLETLGSGFVATVDAALARWIDASWGQTELPLPGATPAVMSRAWLRIADLIAAESGLSQAADHLRSRFLEDRTFLSALAEGRARDPEGRSWLALARHQADRSLLKEWWRLCELPPEVPWYHGMYGIQGLRSLPAERPEREGLFPQEVAEGLARLADALAERTEEGWLSPATAEGEFSRIAELTMAAYGAPERWISFWRHTLQAKRLRRNEARKWVQGLFPKELKEIGTRARDQRLRWMEPNPEWPQRARQIAFALQGQDWSVLDQARQLLKEEAGFAEATGDSYDVVRSACNLAGKVRESRPDLAVEWVDLARRYDSWNAFAWTTRVAALVELDRLPEALDTSLQTIRRFPHNVVARTGLGEVLKTQGRLEEAEAVYRETVRTFRENVVARAGLGEVLKVQGRLEEAEAVYRETVRTFREDVVARTGLGEVLKTQGRLEEAEAVYRETVRLFPQDAPARRGLQGVLRARGHASPEIDALDSTRTDSPEPPPEPRRESVARSIPFPVSEVRETPPVPYLGRRDLEILLQDVYLLRRWGGASGAPGAKRERARKLLSNLVREDSNTKVVETLGLLQIEDGDLDQALALLREAARRFPGSARVRYVLARAEREAAARRGRLDEQKPEAPVLSWRRLGRLDERFRPLQLLGEARTWLVQTDGAIVADNARHCLDQLGRWMIRVKPFAEVAEEKDLPETSRFVSWWGGEVGKYLFESTPLADSVDRLDLTPIQERIETQTIPLNRLEEDWLQHFARA